jgi:aspartate beta-hydroxylase
MHKGLAAEEEGRKREMKESDDRWHETKRKEKDPLQREREEADELRRELAASGLERDKDMKGIEEEWRQMKQKENDVKERWKREEEESRKKHERSNLKRGKERAVSEATEEPTVKQEREKTPPQPTVGNGHELAEVDEKLQQLQSQEVKQEHAPQQPNPRDEEQPRPHIDQKPVLHDETGAPNRKRIKLDQILDQSEPVDKKRPARDSNTPESSPRQHKAARKYPPEPAPAQILKYEEHDRRPS